MSRYCSFLAGWMTLALWSSATLVAAEPNDPFNGQSLAGWTTTDGKPVPGGWEMSDGVLHLNKKNGQRAGNIVTAQEYGDFELSFEWKIAARGNNGIKYRVRPIQGQMIGCEYQVYDDAGAKNPPPANKSAGSLYDLYEPVGMKQLQPAGEYNQAKIVVRGNRLEHWLNGERIVLANVGDDEWKKRIAASKFNDRPEFAINPRGKIMITDHGSEVWYRNFAIKVPPQAKEQTLTYKQVGDLEIKADVISPIQEGPRPVVVWIHGGALINGHRASVPVWLRDAAIARGYAVVSIDYRLAPESKLPEIIADVTDALKWIREQGPTLFNADPKRIAVCGGSAGGYLTLVTGHRADPRPNVLVSLWGYGDLLSDEYNSPSPHPRHKSTVTTREAAYQQVAGSPVSDSRERKGDGGLFYQFCRQQGIWPQAVTGWNPKQEAEKFYPYLPERNVTSAYPPTFLIHGDADTDVPYECSAKLASLFEKNSVEHRLIRFPGAEHGLQGADRSSVDKAYHEAFEFLAKHLESVK